jgi:hypothetical protein
LNGENAGIASAILAFFYVLRAVIVLFELGDSHDVELGYCSLFKGSVLDCQQINQNE